MSRLGLDNKDLKGYSLGKALLSLTDRMRPSSTLEREVSDQVIRDLHQLPLCSDQIAIPTSVIARAMRKQTRDMTAGIASAGGHLVATEHDDFIDLLVARSAARRAGVQVLEGLVGNVAMPRLASGSTAYWLTTEGTGITESQPVLGSVAMTPKNVGAYVECSRQLMLQGTPGPEKVLATDMTRQITKAVDAAVFQGTGTNGQPLGLANMTLSNGFTGTALDYAAILDAMGDVFSGDIEVDPATCCFVTTPAVSKLLKNRYRVANTDTPIWKGSMLEGEIEGHKALSSVNMPSATALFGDFGSVMLGQWGPAITVEVNPYANFPAGINGFRVIYSCDVLVRASLLFTIASSIT